MAQAHAKFVCKPAASHTSECSGHDVQSACKTAGPLSAKWHQLGQAFSKGSASASWIIAEKASHMQQEADRLFSDWQVTRDTTIVAMHSERQLLTAGAGHPRRCAMSLDEESHIDRPDGINGKARKQKW